MRNALNKPPDSTTQKMDPSFSRLRADLRKLIDAFVAAAPNLDLPAIFTAFQDDLDAAVATHEVLRAEAARSDSSDASLLERMAALEAERDDLRLQLDTMTDVNEDLRAQLSKTVTQNSRLRKKLDELEVELEEEEETVERLEDVVEDREELRARLDEAAVRIEDLEEELELARRVRFRG